MSNQCPKCGGRVFTGEKFCTHCGASVEGIPPNGLPLGAKVGIAAVVVIVLFAVLSSMNNAYRGGQGSYSNVSVSSPGSAYSGQPLPTKSVTIPKAVSNLQYTTIRDNMQLMTEAQFSLYIDSIRGTRIRWTGWIDDVKRKSTDKFEASIDMDNPKTLSIPEIWFFVPESLVSKLSTDCQVTFEGEIKDASDLLSACSVILQDPVIVSYKP